MKCPYRKTIKTVGNKTVIAQLKRLNSINIYAQPAVAKVIEHRYEGGFTTVTLPECRKVFSEIEEKE